MKLYGKVALVTGAGSGIGRAIAERYIAEGANVVAADIDPVRLDALSRAMELAGCTVTTIAGDVSDCASAEAMVDLAIKTFGHLDIVVNNAAVMDEFMPLGEVDNELWRHVLGVNLDGPMYITRRALPGMITQGHGVFVNVASVAGVGGGTAGTAYTTSKHALIGLTRSIAYQYAQKRIRANALCPGGVSTHLQVNNPSHLGFERLQTMLASSVRVATPEEIAHVALFLASDESSFVNGDVLMADGGWTAG